MISDERLQGVADALVGIAGVRGVMLGGSRARGDHTTDSDVDLGVYYQRPLDVPSLRDLARSVAGPAADVTDPGDWGPWVDGGGWLTVDGVAVDWIYRDLDRVHRCWTEARAGRYAFHTQAGHPLGVPDFAYAGEVALGVVLADPSGELATLQRETGAYPSALARALVDGLWEAEFLAANARKAVSRGDSAYLAGCLFRVVALCAHALHGHAGRWVTNEKGLVTAAAGLAVAPAVFRDRAQQVLAHVGRTPAELSDTLDVAEELVRATREVCSR